MPLLALGSRSPQAVGEFHSLVSLLRLSEDNPSVSRGTARKTLAFFHFHFLLSRRSLSIFRISLLLLYISFYPGGHQYVYEINIDRAMKSYPSRPAQKHVQDDFQKTGPRAVPCGNPLYKIFSTS
ncbi:unnamed protein product [Nezara viridula]|uniref:Uncharacterized protein n=1 Tax=Nezara viridula TaxID=85310 RepID=A0A9P0HIM8_NEZVI|nr:unnamed protein product [Nezara viridula]CAH1403294.1 unnamed protein product [Nezara viridula]